MSGRPSPREDIAPLDAYIPELPAADVLLHANENPYPPPEAVMREFLDAAGHLGLNRYPDHAARELRAALASYAGVDGAWVWVGTGSNEILLDACLAYGGPGRRALLFEPTYSMHHRQAIIAGTAVERVSRRPDFTLDANEAVAVVRDIQPDVVFVCTPNNPTGTLTQPDDVVRIAEAADGLVVVDEAYFEFCGVTLVGHLGSLPNVIVVRTLSKAFRMAGVRLGYALAQPETLAPLLKVRMPYAQSSLNQLAALAAVRSAPEMLDAVPSIVTERDRLAAGLSALGFEVFPSAANFVLFRARDAARVAAGLIERRIVIRDVSRPGPLDGCLRVTAGAPAQTDVFLDAVSALV